MAPSIYRRFPFLSSATAQPRKDYFPISRKKKVNKTWIYFPTRIRLPGMGPPGYARNSPTGDDKEAQQALRPGSLRLVPPEDQRAAWEQDYEAMRESMFFGETPDFAEILSVVGDFERRFNGMAGA